MAEILTTQSQVIKRILHDPGRGRVVLVSANGVDIYRVSDWTRVAWAVKANLTCAAINDAGIYLGTSDDGVWRLPGTVSGAATSSLLRVFGVGAVVELASETIRDLAGHGPALGIVTTEEFLFLPDLATVYAGPTTAIACAISGSYVAWASSGAVEVAAYPSADWTAGVATIDIVANQLVFEADTDNLLICHAAGLMLFDAATSAVPLFDDFSDEPTTSAQWTYSNQGGSGSHGQSGGEVTLSPQQNIINSVAMRRPGSHTSAKVRAKLVGDGTNASRYLTVSIGAGPIVDVGNGGATDWWSTSLATGYCFSLLVEGSSTGITLYRRPGAGVARVILATGAAPANWQGDFHDYELKLGGGRVKVIVDDVVIIDVADTNYVSGDILIAQGEYSDGRGATAHLDNISWTTASSWSAEYAAALGAVTNCASAWKNGACLAYGTSNGEDGGRFGVLDISDPETVTNKTTTDGDCSAVWIDDALTAALHDNTLERYRLVAELSPAAGARDVRRDWTLYAEITDALGGIQPDTVALSVNGVSQTPTVEAITDGFAVTYTPGSNSGYAERFAITISGIDSDGNTVSRSWVFTTVVAPTIQVTESVPPNKVFVRDVELALGEAEEIVDGVPVVWLEEIVSPLIVDDVQAKRIGTVAIDGKTFHEWRLSATFLPTDADGLATRDLRQGDTVAVTVPKLGLNAKPCVLLAKARTFSRGLVRYRLLLAYYEAV